MVRGGAVLPLLPPAVDTLAPYGRAQAGVVHLADRRRRLDLLAFPDGRWAGELGRGGRLVSAEGSGVWRLHVRAGGATRFRLQAAMSDAGWRPCSVALDDRPLSASRWSFDPRTAVLRARFEAREATLEVSRRAC